MAIGNLMVRLGMESSQFKKGVQDAKRESRQLLAENQKLTKSVVSLEKEYRDLSAANKQNTSRGKYLRSEIRKLNGDLRSNRKLLSANSRMMRESGKSAGFLANSLKSVAAPLAGFMAVGTVANAVGGAVRSFADFDDQMRKVGATMGATGAQVAELSDIARQMGATTRYTAAEAAQGLQYMALAGWDTQQAMAGLPGLLSLSAAAGMDLGTASDIVTDTMSAFGLEASQVTMVADLFATAQSKSNTSVEQLGEAMSYAAPIAAGYGQNLATTTSILGAFANAGIKGSMAGTAFRAIFNDLIKSSKDGEVQFGNTTVALYDQNGAWRDLGDILTEITNATKTLDDEQRTLALTSVFGAKALAGVNVVVNDGAVGMNNLRLEMDRAAGTAKRMADEMEAGLGGTFRRLRSAASELGLKIGNALAPAIQGLSDDLFESAKMFDAFTTAVSVSTWGNKLRNGFEAATRASTEFRKELQKAKNEQSEWDWNIPAPQTTKGLTAEEAKALLMPVQPVTGGGGSTAQPAEVEIPTPQPPTSVLPIKQPVGLEIVIDDVSMAHVERMAPVIEREVYMQFEGKLLAPISVIPTVSEVKSDMVEMPELPVKVGDGFGNATDQVRSFTESIGMTGEAFYALGQAAQDGFAQMASGSASAGQAMAAFGTQAAAGIMRVVQANLMAAASEQAKANSVLGIIGVPLIGAAIGAIFGMIHGALSKTKKVQLAKGGLAYGRTMAEIGEYSGASMNPEVVAPLDKLKGMIADVGGRVNVSGNFRVRGSDLVLALDNAKRETKAFR